MTRTLPEIQTPRLNRRTLLLMSASLMLALSAPSSAQAVEQAGTLTQLPEAGMPALVPVPEAGPLAGVEAATSLKPGAASTDNVAAPSSAAKVDSFREMLEATYTNNPRILAERQALQVKDEGVASAASGFRPSAAYGFETGYSDTNSSINGDASGNVQDQEFRAEQPLFRGGSTWAGFKAAQDRARAGQSQLMAVEQSVLLEAVTAYMDVLSAQAILELSRNNRDVLEKQLKASQERFEVGEVTRTDVAQSQARLSQARTNVIASEGAVLTALAVFERVVGFKPTGSLKIPEVVPELPVKLEDALEMARAANPDLMAALRTEMATQRDIDNAIGTILPQITLVGLATRQEAPGRLGGISLDDDRVTVNFRVPLYQSGSEYAAVRAAKAAARQQKHVAMETRVSTEENVARAWERMDTSIATIAERYDQIKAAQIALEGVKQEEEYGARTVLDVLDAEQELFLSQTNLVRAERERVVAIYNLLLTIGQLTPERLELGIASYDPTKHFDATKWKAFGF
ncbi:MAG: TolC family outer membrane protein [Alphaproteobacteria bacterium]